MSFIFKKCMFLHILLGFIIANWMISWIFTSFIFTNRHFLFSFNVEKENKSNFSVVNYIKLLLREEIYLNSFANGINWFNRQKYLCIIFKNEFFWVFACFIFTNWMISCIFATFIFTILMSKRNLWDFCTFWEKIKN